ncbi:MAG: WG repeat-containing protein [Clostridia bacterium]|nr:WG repeat-containing protein [Clostridia bacterium]
MKSRKMKSRKVVRKGLKLASISLLMMLVLTMFNSCFGVGDIIDDDLEPSDGWDDSFGDEGKNDIEYDIWSIGEFNDGLAVIETESGYGYIDTTGKVIVQPLYDEASDFDGVAKVEKDGVTSIINPKGETIYVKPTDLQGKIGPISNGYFWVQTVKEEITGSVYTMTYYDKDGNTATIENAKEAMSVPLYSNNLPTNISDREEYTLSSANEQGIAVVEKNDVYDCFVDVKTGQPVYFEGFDILSKGEYRVSWILDNKYIHILYDYSGGGYYGSTVLRVDFDKRVAEETSIRWSTSTTTLPNIKAIGEYDALYEINSKHTLKTYHSIVKDNQTILNLEMIDAFGDANVRDISYINTGKKPAFSLYLESSSGVFFSAIIDVDGNIIMAPTNELSIGYESYYKSNWLDEKYSQHDYSCNEYHAGLCVAKKDELFGFIDASGIWIISPKYGSVTDFYGEGESAVAVVNNSTIINSKDEVVFSIE